MRPILFFLLSGIFIVLNLISRRKLPGPSSMSLLQDLMQIKLLANHGCIEGLCNLLICPDRKIVKVCPEGLKNILMVGEADKEKGLNDGVNIFVEMVDDCGGLHVIVILQTDEIPEIREKAEMMSEKFWAEDSEWVGMNDFIRDLAVTLNCPPGF